MLPALALNVFAAEQAMEEVVVTGSYIKSSPTDGATPIDVISRDNIDEMLAGTSNPSINRLLGTEGGLGEMLGLDDGWAARAIAANGNYGEIFADTIGEDTIIGLPRGVNALWTEGGLMYAPPFR